MTEIQTMAARLSVLTRALPKRILLVEDDDLELDLLAQRIGLAGFEATCAKNGEEALERLAQQWFPVIITDWQMPVMDGIAFVETLRSRGVDDSYVVMLTMREDTPDYERGYRAGVDDYLTKRVPEAELLARIHAAFNAISLRRSLKDAQQALANSLPIDPSTGAFTVAETLTKLQAELHRSRRYGRKLSVLLVGIEPGGAQAGLKRIVEAIQQSVRAHVDWIGRVERTPHRETLVIVLPEAAPTDGPKIKERIRERLEAGDKAVAVTFGLVGCEQGGEPSNVDAKEILAVAEHCRGCAGRSGPAQLNALQRSVALGVTIACRHGYAVASSCALKSDPGQDPFSGAAPSGE
jgi:two-component system cell cycle response regulator